MKKLLTDSPLSESNKTPQDKLNELLSWLKKIESSEDLVKLSTVEGIKEKIRILLVEHPDLKK